MNFDKYDRIRPADFRTFLKQRLRRPEGLGTLEIVIIIAVLLAVALLFREQIMSFAQNLMGKVFDGSILDGLGN